MYNITSLSKKDKEEIEEKIHPINTGIGSTLCVWTNQKATLES